MKEPMKAWFDGCCKPNPEGVATYGYVIREDNGQLVEDEFGYIGEGEEYSATKAEFIALKKLLTEIIEEDNLNVNMNWKIWGDCRPVVHSAHNKNKLDAISQKETVNLHNMVEEIEPHISWIPRHQNGEADSLSKRAYAVHEKRKEQEQWRDVE